MIKQKKKKKKKKHQELQEWYCALSICYCKEVKRQAAGAVLLGRNGAAELPRRK